MQPSLHAILFTALLFLFAHTISAVSLEAHEIEAGCAFNYDNPDVDWKALSCTQTCDSQIYTRQSPVAIKSELVDKTLMPINFAYQTSDYNATMMYDGETIITNLTAFGKSFGKIDSYNVVQMHLHQPAENMGLNESVRHDMELHIVHKDPSTGMLLVVGFFIDVGTDTDDASAWIADLAALAAQAKNNENVPINVTLRGLDDTIAHLQLNDLDGYWTFAGSLTTPPCSEIVTWFVMKHVFHISSAVEAQLTATVEHNARPIQRNLTAVAAFDPKALAGTPSSPAKSAAVALVAPLHAALLALVALWAAL